VRIIERRRRHGLKRRMTASLFSTTVSSIMCIKEVLPVPHGPSTAMTKPCPGGLLMTWSARLG
jgi:hypothetical protein